MKIVALGVLVSLVAAPVVGAPANNASASDSLLWITNGTLTASASTDPDVMKSTSDPKNGLPLCSA